jgi:isopenicillin N synthase-like dioxygenase
MMSLSLGLEQNCIESIFGDKPAPYTKLICYPQTRPGSMGVGEITLKLRQYIQELCCENPAVVLPAAIEPAEPYYLALLGPNQWLQEELLPGFHNTVLEYIAAISKLSRQLLGMMSLSLGLEQNCIESIFGDKPAPYTKLICYPQTRPGSMGVGEITLKLRITILLQDCLPGLEARSTTGEWMAVDPVSDSLVVNIGELMQMMSANYFVAAPHRVRNVSDQVRYSSAFFDHPDLRAAISPLPIAGKLKERVKASKVHSSAGLMPSVAEMASGVKNMQSVSKPTSVGKKYWRRWVRSYPDIARHYYGEKSLLL